MTWESSIALTIACAISMAAPGPGVMALVGHALGNGFRRSTGFIVGMVTGDLIYLTFAILGMAALARSFEGAFMIIRLTAACYLIYLGIRAWRSAPVVFKGTTEEIGTSGRRHQSKGFVSGLLTTLSNPKVMMFYVGFLPSFVDLTRLTHLDVAIVAGIVAGVLSLLMASYAMAAGRARHLLKSARAVRALNRGSGSVMIGAGVFIAARG